jgi:hypothetical protein
VQSKIIKCFLVVLATLLILNQLLCLSKLVFAEANKGIESKIVLSMRWEWLEYEEHMKEILV